MRTLPRPARDSVADLELVIATTTDADRKAVLEGLRPILLAAYDAYAPAALRTGTCPAAGLTAAQRAAMEASYDALRTRAALKPIRAELFDGTAPGGYCPMCGIDTATTLDHYAPKDTFAELAVFALNLVPACATCNLRKLNTAGNAVDTVPFVHHYLHSTSAEVLHATVHIDGGALSVSYSLKPAPGMSAAEYALVENQAGRIKLLDRLERAVTGELVSAAAALDGQTSAEVRATCGRFEERFRAQWGTNNWKSVLYRALVTSDEFCDGGFQLLGP